MWEKISFRAENPGPAYPPLWPNPIAQPLCPKGTSTSAAFWVMNHAIGMSSGVPFRGSHFLRTKHTLRDASRQGQNTRAETWRRSWWLVHSWHEWGKPLLVFYLELLSKKPQRLLAKGCWHFGGFFNLRRSDQPTQLSPVRIIPFT